jgi:hypothetical protein
MTNPLGKYGAEAQEIADRTKAKALMLIIIDGERGSGFTIVDATGGKITKEAPGILRLAADDLDSQAKGRIIS